jgi:hypothetical protein
VKLLYQNSSLFDIFAAMRKETLQVRPVTDVFIFESPKAYDFYCKQARSYAPIRSYDGGRAHGIRFSSGDRHIIIDKSYYLRGGIPEELLSAIVLHELVEFESTHREATFAEYDFVASQFGIDALQEYHARLCTLVGGLNDLRNEALQRVVHSLESESFL